MCTILSQKYMVTHGAQTLVPHMTVQKKNLWANMTDNSIRDCPSLYCSTFYQQKIPHVIACMVLQGRISLFMQIDVTPNIQIIWNNMHSEDKLNTSRSSLSCKTTPIRIKK